MHTLCGPRGSYTWIAKMRSVYFRNHIEAVPENAQTHIHRHLYGMIESSKLWSFTQSINKSTEQITPIGCFTSCIDARQSREREGGGARADAFHNSR